MNGGQDPQKPYDPAHKAGHGVPVGAPNSAPNYTYPQGQPPMQVDQYGRPVVYAQPPMVQQVPNNANIQRDAQGNALCRKCSAPYPLPAGCTSWRCRTCHELNNASIRGDECCIIS